MGRWRFNQRDASVAAAINTLFTPIKYDPSTSLSQLLSQVSSKSSAYENDHFRSFFFFFKKEIKHRPSIHHGLVVTPSLLFCPFIGGVIAGLFVPYPRFSPICISLPKI
ncbi:hypothetical protein BDV37DRAFT_119049 [Aspergillus pseudonomiae]|uniref:Uncharacterized protein n=1 Tax=Aspergillus pseudonomiae TaxID=1506151 RepID=A0A5N7DD25_9EURO|nr:uncharacterized protein BDV37DRAFT_119049 [Aspergillus pseudonomiae]KAE8404139.1 hypothetical protein BDV37DRAFT_119049 [Aspergillus pseudonomiae]